MNERISFRVSPLTILLLLLAGLSLTACSKREGSESRTDVGPQAPQTVATRATPPPDGVRRIGLSELQDALEKGEAVVVDVRGSVEYKLGHIRAARSVPLGLIAQQIKDLPRDKLIVTYCA